jgi:hypothetical protein
MKIETAKDLIRKKTRAPELEEEVDVVSGGFVDQQLAKRRKANEFASMTRPDEEQLLRERFASSGMLKFGGDGTVRDARISPKKERQLLEFASHLTRGDLNAIVEFADNGYSVYTKGSNDEIGSRDHIVEFAEYPRSSKRQKMETNEA